MTQNKIQIQVSKADKESWKILSKRKNWTTANIMIRAEKIMEDMGKVDEMPKPTERIDVATTNPFLYARFEKLCKKTKYRKTEILKEALWELLEENGLLQSNTSIYY